ncbi:hypothetical protein CAEBREN_11454 [Caenorhabditis brenneri]|uniref:Uncharacterized protein n=1 Tax=Caenorhabditis brenneri TaxID=135651 RepID=G0MJP0_CAEBE|nr:hypothetical protein CAEBREN_11454 [Caenorhabditis brenneri]
MNHNISDPLFDILKKYVGEKMAEQIERDRRIAEREQREEESRKSGLIFGYYFSLAMFILIMDPINNTFSDQLMKFVANEMKEEMERKQRRADYSDVLIIFAPLILFMVIALLAMIIPYLWNWWISGRSGPLTRYPIVPFDISELKLYTGMKSTGNMTPEAKIQVSCIDPNNTMTDPCCRPYSKMSDEEYREMEIESLKKVLPIILGILGVILISAMNLNNSSVIPCHPDKEIMRESMKRQGIVMLMVVVMVLLSTAIVVVCEHFNRKWESQRSRKVTRIPKTPINEKRLILFNGSQFSENKTPEAKILISGPVSSKNKESAKLNTILKMIFGLEDLAYEQPRATTQRLPNCRNVRYCRELKRGMMTDDESDAVYHQEWDPASKSMKTWKCNGCSGNVDGGVPPSYSSLSMV